MLHEGCQLTLRIGVRLNEVDIDFGFLSAVISGSPSPLASRSVTTTLYCSSATREASWSLLHSDWSSVGIHHQDLFPIGFEADLRNILLGLFLRFASISHQGHTEGWKRKRGSPCPV